MKLVSILRHSHIAHDYRFGSSSGVIYVVHTYRSPKVSPEMAGVVLNAEGNILWV